MMMGMMKRMKFSQMETQVGENVAEDFLDYVQKVANETYKK